MTEVLKQYLTVEQITARIEDAGEKAKVHPLDPDFLIMLFAVALPFDIIFAIFELIGLLTGEIPKIIAIPLNFIAFGVISGWSIWRTGKISKSREEQKRAFEKTILKKGTALEKQLAKSLARRGLRIAVRRILIRGVVAVIGGILPLIAFIPFWSISVILVLREK